MDQLVKLARTATPESGVQFRGHANGHDGIRAFRRDVLALAKASDEGKRYVGVDVDARGQKRKHAVPEEDF